MGFDETGWHTSGNKKPAFKRVSVSFWVSVVVPETLDWYR